MIRLVLAALTACLMISAAQAQDTLKLAIGQRGNWGKQRLRTRPGCRLLQEARPDARNPVHGGRRPNPASGHLRQRGYRHRRRHVRRAGRIRQGRAAAGDRQFHGRRARPLLVRSRRLRRGTPWLTPPARPSPIPPPALRPISSCAASSVCSTSA